jgi:metallo-beta-lactamase family protein
MRLGFYGAAGEVTGSNFVLETETAQIIIDCGMFQGRRMAEKQNYSPFPFDPKKAQAMILTHAHLDHCGRVPKLWREGFRGPIYCTPATRDLAELVMKDAAQIMLYDMEDDEQQEPLYLAVDVANVLNLFEPVEYHERTEIAPNVFATYYDAGHILGAASILVEADGKRIIFSGDIGNHPVPILRNPEALPAADYVIMESTYGGRTHESPADRRVKLRSVIRRAAEYGGTLLIPAFAVERTQEILYELGQLVQEQAVPSIPVFLDSPLAIEATHVYHRYPQYFDEDALMIIQNGGDFLNFPQLRMTTSADQSRAIKNFEGAKIIIAGSGMMEGGRIVHHAKEFLTDSSSTLLFVGYQAEGTLGREIFEGKRKVTIKQQFVNIKAHVMAIGAYSAHADQPGLKQWLDAICVSGEQPERVFLVHGEQDGAADFAKYLGKEYTVTIPKLNEVIELT